MTVAIEIAKAKIVAKAAIKATRKTALAARGAEPETEVAIKAEKAARETLKAIEAVELVARAKENKNED